jgi:hypothetical protein
MDLSRDVILHRLLRIGGFTVKIYNLQNAGGARAYRWTASNGSEGYAWCYSHALTSAKLAVTSC